MKNKKENAFGAFLAYEANHFFSIRNKVFVIILLLMAVGFTQYGVNRFYRAIDEKDTFRDVEKQKVGMFFNYRIMGLYGFHMTFLPHPMGIFFINSTSISDMRAYVDVGERLRIYDPLQGGSVFKVRQRILSDFSGFMLFLISLMAVSYGYETFFYREYLRSLVSFTGKKRVFFCRLAARALMLLVPVFLATAAAILVVVLNGVIVPGTRYLLEYLLEICMVAIFFFVLGTVFGSWRQKMLAIPCMFVAWAFFLFIVPVVVNMLTAHNADNIPPVHKIDLEKLKIVMDFEKKMHEKFGTFDEGKEISDDVKDKMLQYFKNEIEKLQELDQKIIDSMLKTSAYFHRFSILSPVSSYFSVSDSLSGKGYDQLIDFYRHVKKIKKEFFEFFMIKVYFSNYAAVEPFLKGDDNVFTGTPRIHRYVNRGRLISWLWILALSTLSYFCYKKMLVRMRVRDKDIDDTGHLSLKKGQFKEWTVNDGTLKDILFNTLVNETKVIERRGYALSVTLEDFDGEREPRFLYLCRPRSLPGGIRVRDLVALLFKLTRVDREKRKTIFTAHGLDDFAKKKTGRLTVEELARLYLAILDMGPFDIYLINDITRGMYLEFAGEVKKKLDRLWNHGALVLYIYTDSVLRKKDDKKGRYFRNTRDWSRLVDDIDKY